VIVAVPFSCVRPDRVSMRGVILCPQLQTSFLLSRLCAGEHQRLDNGALKRKRPGHTWVKKHFDLVDPPSARVQFPPFGFKRYLAFTRFRDAVIGDSRFSIAFDMFVGPGDFPLPVDDQDKSHSSSRAINGFADVWHYPVFDNEVAKRKRSVVTGHAAVCVVDQSDDLFSDGWRLGSNRILKVITEDKAGAMLLVEATTHWRQRRMGFDPDPLVRDEVADPLKRGFIFRARLIVKVPKVANKQVVGL